MVAIRPSDLARGVLACAVSIVLASCGNSAPSSTPLTAAASPQPTTASPATPDVTPSPAAPASPTIAAESGAPSAASNTFVSTQYPYSLTYPPGTVQLGWFSADRTWNSSGRWDMGEPYTDRNLTAEGGLHIFGAPASSLDEFFAAIKANGTRHRCTEPANRRDATIDGAVAIGFTQVCDNGTSFARVVIFKDGYGLAMFVNTPPGGEIAGRDKAFELLEGLEWRTG